MNLQRCPRCGRSFEKKGYLLSSDAAKCGQCRLIIPIEEFEVGFKEGESVKFSWRDHQSRTRRDKPSEHKVILHTGDATFIRTDGKSAVLEFSTPSGPWRRKVPLKQVSKKQS